MSFYVISGKRHILDLLKGCITAMITAYLIIKRNIINLIAVRFLESKYHQMKCHAEVGYIIINRYHSFLRSFRSIEDREATICKTTTTPRILTKLFLSVLLDSQLV